VVSGGSTLTMQVLRLARGSPNRTYAEKLVEMMMALRLEMRYSKREILSLYAGHAPFGGNVVGLEAAAWRYFGRGPDQLSWAEACTLAVLPNSPALIHPGKNRDLLIRKRDRLLRALHEERLLTDMELDLALHEGLPDAPLALPRNAPHLLDTLTTESTGRPPRFESTLDSALQASVEGIVERYGRDLERQGIRNATVLVVDNRSFEVLAYVGNRQWSLAEDQSNAVDIARRPRSTGSVLKPLLYAAMLEAGEILPTTLIPDLPTQYGGFMPENFDHSYRGAVPAQFALARSLNIPAVRMLKQHGVPGFHAFLRQIGMTTLYRAPDDYGLTLILGGAEGTLWDLTGIYANLADVAERGLPGRIGTYRKLKVLRSQQIATDRAREVGPGAAWLTMNALMEVNRPDLESHWKNFSGSQRIAWKTGTSFGQRDGWAIGSTARYTVGVWVGNATGEGRPDLTGVGSAAPILFAVFNRLGPSPWFHKPEADLRAVEVCKDDGFLPNGGCQTETQWAPAGSHFERASPYHRVVHLDSNGKSRVHAQCESPSRMRHQSWFVLPPGQEFYYRKYVADYRPLPSYRADCAADLGAEDRQIPIDFLYPNLGTRLYIPIDLAAKKGRTVFEAVHRDPKATLYWHLDDRYLGSTTVFHQQALDIEPGIHLITVVDQQGNRLARQFEVLDKRLSADR
jgi:penicillin-binding protein 1C